MLVLPNLIYKLNAITIKIPVGFLLVCFGLFLGMKEVQNWQANSRIYRKYKGPETVKTILKEKNTAGGFKLQ